MKNKKKMQKRLLLKYIHVYMETYNSPSGQFINAYTHVYFISDKTSKCWQKQII